jgi:hypothetical protein
MANIISKEIFSIGKGGMRKKQSSAMDILHWYMAKKNSLNEIFCVCEREACVKS